LGGGGGGGGGGGAPPGGGGPAGGGGGGGGGGGLGWRRGRLRRDVRGAEPGCVHAYNRHIISSRDIWTRQ
jgi:hypothetical protein